MTHRIRESNDKYKSLRISKGIYNSGYLRCVGVPNLGKPVFIGSAFLSGNAKQRRTERRRFIAALRVAWPGVEVRL